MSDSKPKSYYYTTPSGVVLKLARVPAELIYDLQSSRGKPVPPTKSVILAGGGRAQIEDDQDPAYRALLHRWVVTQAMKLTKLVAVLGVEDTPPDDVVKRFEFFGYQTPEEIKYAWVQQLIDGVEENFLERVIALSMASEEGLEEAENVFRSSVPPEPGSDEETDVVEESPNTQIEGPEAFTEIGNYP